MYLISLHTLWQCNYINNSELAYCEISAYSIVVYIAEKTLCLNNSDIMKRLFISVISQLNI